MGVWKRLAPLLAERAGFAHKKRIRAAHAEKQQIRETCRRPNRLNLSLLTAWRRRRSNFFADLAENQTGLTGLDRTGESENPENPVNPV
jgi:hypothetical protein